MSLIICRKISRDEMVMVGDGYTVDGFGNILSTNKKKIEKNSRGYLFGIVGDVDSVLSEEVVKFDKTLTAINLKEFFTEILEKIDDKTLNSSVIVADRESIYNVNINDNNTIIVEHDDFCAIGSGKVQALTLKPSYLSPKKILKHIIDNNLNCFVGGKIREIRATEELSLSDGVDL